MNHTHDYWQTPSGDLRCRCGDTKPRRSSGQAPELTPEQAAKVARFGFDKPEDD